MVMDCIRLRRGIFLVILVAVAFSASVFAQIELESLEHGKWGDKNDQKLVIRDAAGGEIPASSGLGIFDAFFASLSMILVSEDMSQPTPIQELAAKDLHRFEWQFKHIFERPTPRPNCKGPTKAIYMKSAFRKCAIHVNWLVHVDAYVD
ncbi:hypothetical protein Syun_018844 [Stephania yunnanensis]|uniref:Uncharacterized protein n=1 Tax=Stephania yunnanensis TaxID=152371 RepID=A0AAP0IT09_9MAGN